MMVHGGIEKADHAIFADTGWEPAAVYRQVEWLTGVMAEHGIEFHRARRGNLRDDVEAQIQGGRGGGAGKRFASLPYFTLGPRGVGKVQRQCTSEYKLEPIEKEIRKILGLKFRQRWPKEVVVTTILGISWDESQRMKAEDPKRPWQQFEHPLIDRRMTRYDCLEWMEVHGYHEPPRSACLGCPFHSNAEWRRMQVEHPEEFEDAVDFDRKIRKMKGMRGDVYLHRSCKPLDEIDFRSEEERGQLTFGFEEECLGMCGM